MKRIRDSIWNEMKRLQKDMNEMFSRFTEVQVPSERIREPFADIWEESDKVLAEIELPGINKEDIIVNMDENTLEVQAETKKESKKEQKNMFRSERSYSSFYRKFTLPSEIDPSKAQARYRDGVLKIVAPKSKKKKKSSSVKVE